MNGIYDFERYRPPRLDVEMLMERRAKKRNRISMIFLGIAMTLIASLTILVLYAISTINQDVFKIALAVFFIYIFGGTIVACDFMKKEGEDKWELQEELQ